jgi:hypothetical protein
MQQNMNGPTSIFIHVNYLFIRTADKVPELNLQEEVSSCSAYASFILLYSGMDETVLWDKGHTFPIVAAACDSWEKWSI